MMIIIQNLADPAKSLRQTLLGIFLVSFSFAASADDTGPAEYRIAAGDTLSIAVFGHEDLSGDCEVDSAGRCSLPLIKFVEAEGMTASELEARIENRLKPDYLRDPQVRVEVIAYRPIFVLGEVRNPGSYPFSVGMTVVNAVALAGGYTYRAKRDKITVVRSGRDEDSKERIQEQDKIYPGDVIEIPERFF